MAPSHVALHVDVVTDVDVVCTTPNFFAGTASTLGRQKPAITSTEEVVLFSHSHWKYVGQLKQAPLSFVRIKPGEQTHASFELLPGLEVELKGHV